jgi:S-DNA-T family DNA segregation ATPase FtsK/SpoIIIE
MGVEPTDYIGHKRFLSFFAGGLLPIISLSFLHMLVKFTQGEKSQVKEEIVEDAVKEETPVVEAKDIVGEVSRVRLNDEQLEVLEKILSKKTSEESVIEEKKSLVDIEPEVQESVVEETPIINEWENEESLEGLVPMNEESPIIDLIQSNKTQIIEEPIVIELHPIDEQPQPVIEPVNEFVPALGDDEVREMVLDEWERKFDLVEDETEEVIIEPIPTSSIVEEPTPTPTTEIVVEETPIVIPIVEEHIVEEIIPEPIIEEQPIPQVEESPIIELPVENEEEKKN